MVKMQHSVQRGFQGYCLSLSGGFSASRLVRWLLGFSACPAASRLRGFSASRLARRLLGLPGGSSASASRLLGLSGGFSASRLLGFLASRLLPASRLLGFSASRLVSYFAASRLLGFSASRLVSGFSASRLLGFWSHFWAPFALLKGFRGGYDTLRPGSDIMPFYQLSNDFLTEIHFPLLD